MKAMNNMSQKWTPGKQRGRNVKVLYKNFRLCINREAKRFLNILSKDKITLDDITTFVTPSSFKQNEFASLFDRFGNLDAVQKYIATEYKDYKG